MRKYIEKANLLALIERYEISQEFEEFLSKLHIEDKYKYTKLSLLDVNQLCDRINNSRFKELNTSESYKTPLWMKGQFKLFIWVSLFYSFNLEISIKQLKKKDFQFFNTIFIDKNVERIKYQVKSLFQTEKFPRKKWEYQEIQLFKQLLQKYEGNQKKPEWKSIAFELFLKSNGAYLRTFGQCRQMFANHLSKQIKRDKWTEKQDEMLLQLAQNYNNKWSKISQMFRGQRSSHMIKNRYFILMKKRTNTLQQMPANSSIKCNSQIIVKSENQRQDSSQKLSLMVQGKEFQTQSYDNSYVKSIGEQKISSLFVQQFSLLEIAVKDQLPFKDMSEIFLHPIDVAKFFNENKLNEHLGCSHYQQIQQAFEEYKYISMDCE